MNQKPKGRWRPEDQEGPLASNESGKIAVLVGRESRCFLNGDADVMKKKQLKKLKGLPAFSIYMGHTADEATLMARQARILGVEVFQLDAPEDWGYDFIAVRNREIVKDGVVLRYDPLQPVEVTSEFEMSENDFRDKPVRLSSFLWGARKIQGAEVPVMIQAQVVTLEQVTEPNS